MDSKATTPSDHINVKDSSSSPTNPQDFSDDLRGLRLENDSEMEELETLRAARLTILLSKYAQKEESLAQVQVYPEKENSDLLEATEDVSTLHASLREREGQLLREKEEIEIELEGYKEKVEGLLTENRGKSGQLSESLGMVKVIKQGMARVIRSMGEEGEEHHIVELEASDGDLRVELKGVLEFVKRVRLKIDEFEEKGKKEKRELEYSLVSLREENRAVYNLLRIALVEKEAMERSLSKLKGNDEQKRGALLQIAERGLQKVGFSFGFMAGTVANECSSETSGAIATANSERSECEEEAVSLDSTVERIMKDLRLEITQLRRSLDESRSETARLQSLRVLQTHEIEESTLYIEELEDREWMLTQKVEKLQTELKETEEEVARWRQACELEVQAGKNVSEEHEKVINIQKQELEKSRAALHASNSKIKLKDELVATAIAAREATERSLQLADCRAAGFCDRIEELTRELGETEKRERANGHKIRHICWPWRTLKFNATNSTNNSARNIRQIPPEMQAALLHEHLDI